MSLTSNKKHPEHEDKSREMWDKKIEFALSLIGYAVGLGNIVRFPYLVQRNGGGSFLVPYTLCLFLCGIPIYYLEIVMGQSKRKSCIACWDLYVPVLKGVGYSMAILSLLFTFYYQVYLAWILYYLGASVVSIVKWEVPWKTCNATWNTVNCVSTVGGRNISEMLKNDENLTLNNAIEENNTNWNKDMNTSYMSAAEEYWQHNVLRLSGSLADVGYPSWGLLVSHSIAWIVMYLCLRKGVRSVGKVVWVTATSPYILICVFLIRASLLPGSFEGVKFYLTPDFETLKDPEVWILGFLQIFYSLGPGWGGICTMASYNKPKHKFHYEALWVPIVCCLTSFINGFVVFSCAGYLALQSGVTVREAVSSGPGLAFITYPEVTSHLPAGPIWAFLFFLMMFMVGADSVFVTLETCATCIKDELPKKFQSIPLFVLVVLNITFGIFFLTNAGMYIFQLLDWYIGVIGIFLTTSLECFGLIWIYGYDRLATDIRAMVGKCPPRYLAVPLVGVLVPLLLTTAMVWTIMNLSKPTYGQYVFPDWSEIIGWIIAVLAALPMPAFAIGLFVVLRRNGIDEIRTRMFRPQLVPVDETSMALEL